MKKKITREVEIHPIMTPNFILIGEDKKALPLQNFTEKELRKLGQEFIREMIEKSKKPLINQ